MADTMDVLHANGSARETLPRYKTAEFGAIDSVDHWLNSLPEYRLVSLTPISVTNHFSKETETSVWVVVELRETAH